TNFIWFPPLQVGAARPATPQTLTGLIDGGKLATTMSNLLSPTMSRLLMVTTVLSSALILNGCRTPKRPAVENGQADWTLATAPAMASLSRPRPRWVLEIQTSRMRMRYWAISILTPNLK